MVAPAKRAKETCKEWKGCLGLNPTSSLSREIHSPCMTKPGGLGVDLSTSRSIIEAQGSTAGRRERTDDATFQFTLPAHPYFVADAA
jgi:hypothetical protein